MYFIYKGDNLEYLGDMLGITTSCINGIRNTVKLINKKKSGGCRGHQEKRRNYRKTEERH